MSSVYNLAGRLVFSMTMPINRHVLNRSRRVRIVIVCGGEILLVKNWLGRQAWSLPGGGVKRGESEQQACLRELYEETGLRISLDTLSKPEPRQYKNDKLGLNFEMAYLLAKVTAKPMIHRTRPLEIIDIGWFKLDKMPNHLHSEVQTGLRAFDLAR